MEELPLILVININTFANYEKLKEG